MFGARARGGVKAVERRKDFQGEEYVFSCGANTASPSIQSAEISTSLLFLQDLDTLFISAAFWNKRYFRSTNIRLAHPRVTRNNRSKPQQTPTPFTVTHSLTFPDHPGPYQGRTMKLHDYIPISHTMLTVSPTLQGSAIA